MNIINGEFIEFCGPFSDSSFCFSIYYYSIRPYCRRPQVHRGSARPPPRAILVGSMLQCGRPHVYHAPPPTSVPPPVILALMLTLRRANLEILHGGPSILTPLPAIPSISDYTHTPGRTPPHSPNPLPPLRRACVRVLDLRPRSSSPPPRSPTLLLASWRKGESKTAAGKEKTWKRGRR
jgi:hypothetical protein